MTAKEYLRQYGQTEREIERLLEEKKRWEAMAMKITPAYSDVPGTGQSGSGKIPAAVEKIVEWEQRIDRKVEELTKLRAEIETSVSRVEDERQQEILKRRYLQGQKWEEIALSMRLDYRWALRLHGRALQKLTIESHP